MKNILILITGLILFNLTFICSAQTNFISDINLKENNRWEGILNINVGNSPLELIAFHAFRLNNYCENDNLCVKFYLPTDSKVHINARNLNMAKLKYRMHVKNENWNSGWQEFSPWHVNEVLFPKRIHANELGILITDNNQIFYPAILEKFDSITPAINNFKAYFYTPEYIDSLVYNVNNEQGTNILSKKLGRKDPRSVFNLLISLNEQTNSGFYKLEINYFLLGKRKNKEYTFYLMKN